MKAHSHLSKANETNQQTRQGRCNELLTELDNREMARSASPGVWNSTMPQPLELPSSY